MLTFRRYPVRENLVEPKPAELPCYGLREHARIALAASEAVTGITARPTDRRDQDGIRGLASAVLRKLHADQYHYGWGDIAWAVYDRRRHNTAHDGARKWAGRLSMVAKAVMEAERLEKEARDA